MDKFQESLDFVVKCKYALFKINIKRNAEYNYLEPKQIDCVKKSIKMMRSLYYQLDKYSISNHSHCLTVFK